MRRRRVNGAFLLGLLITVGVLGGGAHVLHAFQVKRNAGDLLKQATRAEQKGDLKRATTCLRNYLAFRPDDAAALARYGLLIDQMARTPRDREQVFLVLERVLGLDPERADVRRKAADSAMELDRPADARKHAEILLKAAPDDADLELLLGRCDEAQSRPADAAAWYRKASRHAPTRIEAAVRLASLLRGPLKDAKQADRVLDEMVAANPKSSRAYLERGVFRLSAGRSDDAAADAARALALAPEDADALIVAAALAQRREGGLDEARRLLARGIAAHPRDEKLPSNLAQLELRAGRPAEAVAVLRRALEAHPGQVELLLYLADALIEDGQPDWATRIIADLAKKEDVSPAPLDLLRANILANEGRWPQAVEALSRVRANLSPLNEATRRLLGIRADLLLGRCQGPLGNPDLQLDAYRRALEADPGLVAAHQGAAQALAALGRVDEAIAEYEKIAPDVPGAGIAQARLLIARNARLPRDQQRWEDVDRALDGASRSDPAPVEVPILRAQVLVVRGQPDRARALLEQARDAQPKQVGPRIALATLASLSEKPEGPRTALALLDEAGRQLGDLPDLRLARADYWAQHPGDEARRALADLARNLDAFAADDQARLEDGLARASLRIGDLKEAARLWGRLADRQPDNLDVRLLLFDTALRARDDAATKRVLRDLRRIEGEDGALWRFGEAAQMVALAQRGDKSMLPEARVRAAEAASRRPNWARIAALEGEIASLDGDQDRAIERYRRAIELGDRSPDVVRPLIQGLSRLGRQAEADRVLQDLAERGPLTGPLAMLGAELALTAREPGRALDLARRAVPADSADSRDQLWLGVVLSASGPGREAEAEAEAALRRAVKLDGKASEARVALVRHLSRAGQEDKAEAAIQETRRELPPDQAPSVLARCYEAIGRPDQAAEQYRAALAAKPDDIGTLAEAADHARRMGRFAEAEPLLNKILDPKLKAPAREVIRARRALAIGIASTDRRRLPEALALLEQNLQGGGDPEDRRVRALLMATQPEGRREAIGIFEEMARTHPPTPDEQLVVARLHEAEGDWTAARDRMLALLKAHGDNPSYVASFITSLLRRGEAEEAWPWTEELERLEPKAARMAELKANVLKARGKVDQAVAVLKAAADAPEAPVSRIAELLEAWDKKVDAEALFRRHASRSKDPEALLNLAAFLGRRHRTAEALDICDRAWKTCPAGMVAVASLAVLGAGSADDAQFRRVERHLEAAIRETPEASAPLVTQLANLRTLQGRTEDAGRIYRQILEQDPRNLMAMNNLAWVLCREPATQPAALEMIQKAIAMAGPAPALLDTRAVVYLAMGKDEPAAEDLEAAIASVPMAAMYFHLAQARLGLNDPRAATEALRQAQGMGLRAEDLEPLERPAYQALVEKMVRVVK